MKPLLSKLKNDSVNRYTCTPSVGPSTPVGPGRYNLGYRILTYSISCGLEYIPVRLTWLLNMLPVVEEKHGRLNPSRRSYNDTHIYKINSHL